MTTDYRASHQQPGKGEAYDRYVATNPHRAMVWALEQRLLLQIMDTVRRKAPVRLLDFACGTGRILALLENHVDHSVGVDISPDMLSVARRKLSRSELYECDLTKDGLPGNPLFDMITAFRFFPNAEPELRRDAMSTLVRYLVPGGLLVFNNHRHAGSLLDRLARLAGGGGRPAVPDREMRELAVDAGLVVEEEYGIGLLPISERRLQWLVSLTVPLERIVARTNLPFLRRLCQNVIYVCRKPDDQPPGRVA